MKLKIKLEKQNKQNKQGLVPKKVLIHGPKGSFYSIRYVRVGEKEKEEKKEIDFDNMYIPNLLSLIGKNELNQNQLHKLINHSNLTVRIEVAKKIDQSGLHKMINDKSEYIKIEIAKRIDQDGLHKMINDKNEGIRIEVAKRIDQKGLHNIINDKNIDIRIEVAKRIDQNGLHKMINDKHTYIRELIAKRIDNKGLYKMINDKSEYIRKEVAKRIDQKGLHIMMNDESESLRKEVKNRFETLKNMETLINTYKKNKEIKLSENMKNEIDNIMKNNTESSKLINMSDEFYRNINNGKFSNFHENSRDDWEQSSSSELALLLKDSIKRQFGGKIRHHDHITDYDKEANKLYRTHDQKTVDEYVQIQKKLTRKYLDAMFPNIDEITLYRGTTKDEIKSLDENDKKAIVNSNPVSSWTLKRNIAEQFGETGIIMQTKVHKDDIWSTFMTHAYKGKEREILVIGNKDREVEVIS